MHCENTTAATIASKECRNIKGPQDFWMEQYGLQCNFTTPEGIHIPTTRQLAYGAGIYAIPYVVSVAQSIFAEDYELMDEQYMILEQFQKKGSLLNFALIKNPINPTDLDPILQSDQPAELFNRTEVCGCTLKLCERLYAPFTIVNGEFSSTPYLESPVTMLDLDPDAGIAAMYSGLDPSIWTKSKTKAYRSEASGVLYYIKAGDYAIIAGALGRLFNTTMTSNPIRET